MRRPGVKQALTVCIAALALACERRAEKPPSDSVADTARPITAGVSARSTWADELGQLLLVPSDSDNTALVLYPVEPTETLLASHPITFANPNGDTAVTGVRWSASDSVRCGDVAEVRLSRPLPSSWSVGLQPRSVRLLRADSIESLTPVDSSRLVADLARLASAVATPKDSRFTGLPFAVLGAQRIEVDGRQIIVAHLVRRLSQEAAPLEEHTLIVAERSSAVSEPFAVKYTQRSEGSEDTAEHFELLAAMRGRESALLLIARDQLSRTSYELLERTAGGEWRTRWSRTLNC